MKPGIVMLLAASALCVQSPYIASPSRLDVQVVQGDPALWWRSV